MGFDSLGFRGTVSLGENRTFYIKKDEKRSKLIVYDIMMESLEQSIVMQEAESVVSEMRGALDVYDFTLPSPKVPQSRSPASFLEHGYH